MKHCKIITIYLLVTFALNMYGISRVSNNDHNNWVGASTIMSPGTPSYYNGTTRLIYTPQQDDIDGLVFNYGS